MQKSKQEEHATKHTFFGYFAASLLQFLKQYFLIVKTQQDFKRF